MKGVIETLLIRVGQGVFGALLVAGVLLLVAAPLYVLAKA